MVVENVLAGFKVPPEIAIAQRPRRKKKGVSEDVHFEDVSESLVHEVSGDARRGLFGTRQFRLDVVKLRVEGWNCVLNLSNRRY
jgi:hypothetical protein